MKYVSLKDSEKKASRLVYGTGNNAIMGDDEGRAKDCIQRAFDHGFTVFDTAYAYGKAEHNFGLWLAGSGRREQVIILDKGCNPGQEGSADEMSQTTTPDGLCGLLHSAPGRPGVPGGSGHGSAE